MPNPLKVSDLMADFIDWLSRENKLHPVELAGEAHYRLVSIHPVVDGNGRTARLLMNLILMMLGYPPALIRKEDRLVYLSALEKAQLGGSPDDYTRIIVKAVDRSLNIYLKALQEKEDTDADTILYLRIGELAKQVMVTERYYFAGRDKMAGYETSKEIIGDELADIFAMVIRIADHYGIDLVEAHVRARQAEDAHLIEMGV